MTNKSLLQLEAEAQAAAKALEVAKQREEEKKREEERAKEREARQQEQKNKNLRIQAIAVRVLAALQQVGINTASIDTNGQVRVRAMGGRDGECAISIEEHRTSYYSGSDMHRGQLKVVVGDYGSRKSYFSKELVGFNYDKIAALVKQRLNAVVATEKRYQEKHRAKESNSAMIARLRKEFNLGATLDTSKSRYDSRGKWSSYDAPEGHAYIDLGAVTEEQLRAILPVLIEAGVIETKDKE